MKDLYKQLGVGETCDESDLREAISRAPGGLREVAEFILLNPARRAVYDRNRRVVQTIGRLRASLGLNLSRFWPRSRFGDFTTPLAPPRPSAPHHPDDLMTWAWAFGVEPRGDEVRVKPARSPRRRTIVGAIAYVLLMATGLGLWYWLRTP